MTKMLASFFAALTALFTGAERYANAFAKTGEYAEQAADQWVADAKAEAERARANKALPE